MFESSLFEILTLLVDRHIGVSSSKFGHSLLGSLSGIYIIEFRCPFIQSNKSCHKVGFSLSNEAIGILISMDKDAASPAIIMKVI